MASGPSVDQLPPPGEVPQYTRSATGKDVSGRVRPKSSTNGFLFSVNVRSGPGRTTVRAPLVRTATRFPPEVTSVRSGVPDSTLAVSGPRATGMKYETSSAGRVTEDRGAVSSDSVAVTVAAVVAARAGAAAKPPSEAEAADVATTASRFRREVFGMRP